ncbi:acyl-CoA dehydrogenase domain protein (plasmid) [Azospirillum sp. B510]|uniref:acyl-CoA dehydrogenase family protein n=1 Tax=Azospirillum sp. (strain B510) TaxID=137722 RepID=UPI0001C4CC04|nr:acyl-CoA dehydrogenase family protein [Azospirillum sp. B510]BAI74858.1 acyl-CoA dehydrogenase domain protein [Azospirillum sp. B510]
MKLRFDREDEIFREEISAFLTETLPADVVRRTRTGMHPPNEEDRRWWNRVLYERGWSAPHWPAEYGGTGWSPIRQHIFEHECRAAGAPELRWQGLRLLGPVIYTFASAEQKARYLPPILKGEEMWAQGFSEPGAGSDLAALRTSAVLDGDHYVVNGQKMWTSEGQYSELGFFLVRTDPTVKIQQGISMLVMDMATPGITVWPTTMIHGDAPVCEVFLDNVRVPRENMIGPPGSGWNQAKFLLANERTSSAEIPKAFADLRRIRAIASREMKGGRPIIEDPRFAFKLAEVELEVEALEWSVLRVLCDAPSRHPVAARASVLKVRGSELQQKLSELAAEALGQRALREYRRDNVFTRLPEDPSWGDHVPGATADLLYLRACTIFGGAKEVQKNIIAKLAFGL